MVVKTTNFKTNKQNKCQIYFTHSICCNLKHYTIHAILVSQITVKTIKIKIGQKLPSKIALENTHKHKCFQQNKNKIKKSTQ